MVTGHIINVVRTHTTCTIWLYQYFHASVILSKQFLTTSFLFFQTYLFWFVCSLNPFSCLRTEHCRSELTLCFCFPLNIFRHSIKWEKRDIFAHLLYFLHRNPSSIEYSELILGLLLNVTIFNCFVLLKTADALDMFKNVYHTRLVLLLIVLQN